MQKNLVIVESPAKAKTIEKFLGKDYKVLSSYGHIRDLKKKEFSIDIDKDLLRFFQDSFQHDTIIEFLAIDNDQIIATGAVCFYDYPPTFSNQTGRIAYITNMYTKPAYRRQSIRYSYSLIY